MKKLFFLSMLATFLIFVNSCKDACKDLCQNGAACLEGDCQCTTRFTGVHCDSLKIDYIDWTSVIGEPLGVLTAAGAPTGGTAIGTWSQAELDVLNFADTVSTQGTVMDTVKVDNLYPNPGTNVFNVNLYTPQAVKIKMVLVNQKMEVKGTYAFRLSGSKTYSIATQDRAQFPLGAYRLYVTASTATNPHFYKAAFNYLICETTPANATCFQ